MANSGSGELRRLHARVEGIVQGVGFRAYTLRQARQLGLTGWVRNRWDGSVEVVAEGPQGALEDLVRRLKTGPSAAYVSRVEVEWQPYQGEFPSFTVRSTG